MNSSLVMIVSDKENQPYWRALTKEYQELIGIVHLALDNEMMQNRINTPYDLILLDVTNPNALRELITKIHQEHPKIRIIVVHSTPTWKQARELIELGAADIVRKSANPEDIFRVLCPKLTSELCPV